MLRSSGEKRSHVRKGRRALRYSSRKFFTVTWLISQFPEKYLQTVRRHETAHSHAQHLLFPDSFSSLLSFLFFIITSLRFVCAGLQCPSSKRTHTVNCCTAFRHPWKSRALDISRCELSEVSEKKYTANILPHNITACSPTLTNVSFDFTISCCNILEKVTASQEGLRSTEFSCCSHRWQ